MRSFPIILSMVLAVTAAARETKEEISLGQHGTLRMYINSAGKDAPLCLLLPPGPGTDGMARSAMTFLGRWLTKQGYTTAVPISPNRKPFFGENGKLLPEFVKRLRVRDDVADDGKILVAGISNGGLAAFEFTSTQPDHVSAVIAVPGLLTRATKTQKLKGIPVYFRIGAKDNLGWAKYFDEVKGRLEKAGAKLDARLVPGANHSFRINQKELEAWLKSVTKEDD